MHSSQNSGVRTRSVSSRERAAAPAAAGAAARSHCGRKSGPGGGCAVSGGGGRAAALRAARAAAAPSAAAAEERQRQQHCGHQGGPGGDGAKLLCGGPRHRLEDHLHVVYPLFTHPLLLLIVRSHACGSSAAVRVRSLLENPPHDMETSLNRADHSTSALPQCVCCEIVL